MANPYTLLLSSGQDIGLEVTAALRVLAGFSRLDNIETRIQHVRAGGTACA
jgi:hypothetical protein